MRRAIVLLIGFVTTLALAAPPALAQPPAPQRAERDGDVRGVLVRIGAPAQVRAGETERTVVVVGADAVVDGAVLEDLVVVGGDARVSGTVAGDVVMVGGRLELAEDARVSGNVMLHGNATVARAPGAVVAGTVTRRDGIAIGPIAGWLVWLSLTVALVVAGLLFAAAGGRQLDEAAALLLRRIGPVVVTTLVLIAAVPILAIIAFVTVIGIPVGIALLAALVPALGLAGYLVAATALGGAVLRRIGRGRRAAERTAAERAAWEEPALAREAEARRAMPAEPAPGAAPVHPFRDVVLGVVLLQLVMLIPILGVLLVILAAHLGAGALVYRAWLVWRRPRPEAGPELEAREAA